MPRLLRIILGLNFVFSFNAYAFPIPPVRSSDSEPSAESRGNYDYEGIVSLSSCSASLIRFENSKETDSAYVLTNGHCVEGGPVAAGKFISHRPSSRYMTLLSTYALMAGRVQATELVYATMTGTDIALYRVKESYEEIKNRFQVRPLTLSSRRPDVNAPIEIISGYWKKGYSCSIESFVPELREANWVMNDSVRFSRPGCETIGGTSGSPIVAAGTRTVIAINNTGNEDGMKCTMNNPCEVDESGNITFEKGLSYGQQTYQIYSCLDEQNELNLKLPGCQLLH